jgi:hypothetical protein
MSAPKNKEGDTFETWFNTACVKIKHNVSWARVGAWAFPTGNNRFREIFYHMCEEAWLHPSKVNADYMKGDKCHMCGEVVPDGIKMVGLLERL